MQNFTAVIIRYAINYNEWNLGMIDLKFGYKIWNNVFNYP